MNILILGTGEIEQKLINLCLSSKHLDHIFTASKNPLNNIPNIEYNSFEEFAYKAQKIQADLILVADRIYIQNGLVDFCKKNRLNVVSITSKWFNLEYSRLIAKQLMNHYSINNPKTILAPIAFPIVIKTDTPYTTKIANSMQELISIRKDLEGQNVFLEEHLKGDVMYLLSLWDGKNLIHFDSSNSHTEVQYDRLDLLKTKLNFMFSDEKADFIGFFTTKLIWAKNDWYVLDFIMHINEKSDLNSIKSDFLYLLNSAIYQKLDEI